MELPKHTGIPGPTQSTGTEPRCRAWAGPGRDSFLGPRELVTPRHPRPPPPRVTGEKDRAWRGAGTRLGKEGFLPSWSSVCRTVLPFMTVAVLKTVARGSFHIIVVNNNNNHHHHHPFPPPPVSVDCSSGTWILSSDPRGIRRAHATPKNHAGRCAGDGVPPWAAVSTRPGPPAHLRGDSSAWLCGHCGWTRHALGDATAFLSLLATTERT